ncbi:MAG: NADPH-dependent FMN reductase [Candidatus Rokuibacteriota bacterium]|nr:MAG: NADPH-dependent FMN reductase [Candidatus Rokubacteria bacterium]
MTRPVHVLGFAGSLRAHSLNRALLRAAIELTPEGLGIEAFDLGPLPLYDGDVEAAGLPEPVQTFRRRIAAADALLLVTPEYNYSVPGVLKNAIDWASRPPDQPFRGKPIALMGASPGRFGTARAQYHLRQMCVFLDMLPVNRPEVFISAASDKFDPEGRLVDEPARREVRALLEAFLVWTHRLQPTVVCPVP